MIIITSEFREISTMFVVLSVLMLMEMTGREVRGEASAPCRKAGYRYFVSDGGQCDRFHMCDEEGELAAEFLCEDGLVFDMISQQCGLPFKIGCEESGRLLLQQVRLMTEHQFPLNIL